MTRPKGWQPCRGQRLTLRRPASCACRAPVTPRPTIVLRTAQDLSVRGSCLIEPASRLRALTRSRHSDGWRFCHWEWTRCDHWTCSACRWRCSVHCSPAGSATSGTAAPPCWSSQTFRNLIFRSATKKFGRIRCSCRSPSRCRRPTTGCRSRSSGNRWEVRIGVPTNLFHATDDPRLRPRWGPCRRSRSRQDRPTGAGSGS